MKKLSALLAILLAVISTASIFLFSACTSDPETATQKNMLKNSPFIYEYSVDGEEHTFKLTINKDDTYSLYIKDYGNSTSDDTVMTTYTGNWSHVLTYEYEYRKHLEVSKVFTTKKTDVLSIYSLDGCAEFNYFGYHKSKGYGTLFFTDKTIDEAYFRAHRHTLNGIPSGLGLVELSGFDFKPENK